MATWDDMRQLAQQDPIVRTMIYLVDLGQPKEAVMLATIAALAGALANTKAAYLDALMTMPPRPILVNMPGK